MDPTIFSNVWQHLLGPHLIWRLSQGFNRSPLLVFACGLGQHRDDFDLNAAWLL